VLFVMVVKDRPPPFLFLCGASFKAYSTVARRHARKIIWFRGTMNFIVPNYFEIECKVGR